VRPFDDDPADTRLIETLLEFRPDLQVLVEQLAVVGAVGEARQD